MPLFKGSFTGPDDTTGGKTPVIFDVIGPNGTSILPSGWRLVLHANPQTMSLKYARRVERTQTKGGFVEQHWGDDVNTISFEATTGGFMRLYSGLSSITEPGMTGGTRRETLAYDRYLDFLALFHGNGSVYDAAGQVVMQGKVQVTFDEATYTGWFTSFGYSETADKPFQFTLTAEFTVDTESASWRTVFNPGTGLNS